MSMSPAWHCLPDVLSLMDFGAPILDKDLKIALEARFAISRKHCPWISIPWTLERLFSDHYTP